MYSHGKIPLQTQCELMPIRLARKDNIILKGMEKINMKV